MAVRTTSFEQEELDLMARVVEQVIKVKIDRLQSAKSIEGFRQYMLKFIEQFDRNEFNMNSSTDNTCTWLRDQITWCRLDQRGPHRAEAQRLLDVLDQAIEQRQQLGPTNRFDQVFEYER